MNPGGMAWLKVTEDQLIGQGVGYYITCFYVAIVFFCVGIGIDFFSKAFDFVG